MVVNVQDSGHSETSWGTRGREGFLGHPEQTVLTSGRTFSMQQGLLPCLGGLVPVQQGWQVRAKQTQVD